MSVGNHYHGVWHHIPEYLRLNIHCPGDLKTHMQLSFIGQHVDGHDMAQAVSCRFLTA
jgi:hypothetical protein